MGQTINGLESAPTALPSQLVSLTGPAAQHYTRVVRLVAQQNQSVVTAGRDLSYGIPALIDNQFLFARQKDVLVLYATQP